MPHRPVPIWMLLPTKIVGCNLSHMLEECSFPYRVCLSIAELLELQSSEDLTSAIQSPLVV